jgi:hypothetical protein
MVFSFLHFNNFKPSGGHGVLSEVKLLTHLVCFGPKKKPTVK